MKMTAIAFDTLAFSEDLQKAGFSREQADAMARANARAIESVLNADDLVTRKDLAQAVTQIESNLEIRLANTKHDILKWMVTAMIAQTGLFVGIIAFLH